MGRTKKYKTVDEKRKAMRERGRSKRLNETPLERDQRLTKLSQNEWKRRRTESAEERKDRLKRLSYNARKRRAKETADERANRLKKLSESEMKRRARETDDERRIRLQKLAEYAKNRRLAGIKPNKLSKRPRGRPPKKDPSECIDDLEQMQHDPEYSLAFVENAKFKSTAAYRRTYSETVHMQSVPGRKLKQKTKKKTIALRNQLVSANTSSEKITKLNKTGYDIINSVSCNISPPSRSNELPSQEKQILLVPNHQDAVMANLFSMWEAACLCDSYISNGTVNIMVHKMVLGAVCPKLLTSLHSSKDPFPKVVFPSTVGKDGLIAFAEYMYSGVLDLNENILIQLKTIAEELEMKDFEELCCKELEKIKAKKLLSLVEPLLAETCNVDSTMLRKLFANNKNLQRDIVTTTTYSSTAPIYNVESPENVDTDQIDHIKTEDEPGIQLKTESYNIAGNDFGISEVIVNTESSGEDTHLNYPASGVTSSKVFNNEKKLTVARSENQYDSNGGFSEEACLPTSKKSNRNTEKQLILVTSSSSNMSEDSSSNDSDLIRVASEISANSKLS
ncbi:uncharacterized protein LOC115209550 [Argonauta hians]